jgi:hypothetical protein
VIIVFVNRKQTHLIIENVPTWMGTPRTLITENRPI